MILFNKTATVYWYTKNEYGVSSYWETGTFFKCNVQPIDQSDWFDNATVYNTKKLYCEYGQITVGDKISVDWKIYIVRSKQDWDGLKRHFYKLIISESEWN